MKYNYVGMPSKDVLKFHRECILIDLHVDSLLVSRLTRIDLSRHHTWRLPRGAYIFHSDIGRLRLGNVGAVFLGLVPIPFGRNANNIESQIKIAEALARRVPNLTMLARSHDDIIEAKKKGKTALFLGLEGATGLDGDPKRVKYWAKRGVRYFGFVHFNSNFTSFPKMGLGSKKDLGLTKHGKIVLDECLKYGVIIDLAHISRRGFFDIIDLLPQKTPCIVSHTMIKKANNHKRGLDEDQIKALASTGGVMGIMNATGFLGGNKIEDYVHHIMTARDIAGYKHVAIGSDLDGLVIPVQSLEDVSRYPSLTASLLDAGLPRQEIKAIYGENMLRVLKQVPPRYL